VDRNSVIELAANYALYQLWRVLRDPGGGARTDGAGD